MLTALAFEKPVTLCGEPVPVDAQDVIERYEKEMLVSLGDRAQVILWLKRSTRYFPFIEKMLRERGMPDDLKYLAVVESALRPQAGSSKGAMGIWQLMPQTARNLGLTVNGAFDERRNFYLSTPAALTYLEMLYEQFASWSLSLAAYNMGEKGLEAQILEQEAHDYYHLYLPLETQRFVLRVLAIKHIMEHPEKHGFFLTTADYYPPKRFAMIRVQSVTDMPLRLIARAAQTDFKTIKDFNPELRGYYLAAGTRALSIPEGGTTGFQQRLAQLVDMEKQNRRQRMYEVKKGDSLTGIADRFDVPVTALLIWNRIGIHDVIHPGQRLIVAPAPGVNPPHAMDKDAEVSE
ncbi:hypothetical protein JCM12296A_38190 [Desulfosarcina cetonica]